MGSPSSQASTLLQTPLNAAHRRLGARLVDFAGWQMPVQYAAGILAEHQAVRTGCGVFDLSHMGRVFLRGADALALAQECCTRDLARIRAGEAAYSVVCDADGGILDDVIAYKVGHAEVLFVCNASNRLSDVAWFTAVRDRHGWQVEVSDRTFELALLGVQGPRAQEVLQPRCSGNLDQVAGYAFERMELAGASALVSRTGYTGEDGFEVMVPADAAEGLWSALTATCVPCGLGARDTLRTEAGFALYGHEIDRSTHPFEARLGWVVDLGKPSFVGRAALARIKREGARRRLVGLAVAPGPIPRQGMSVLADGHAVGRLTSGTFSPTLRQNIAMGYVPIGASTPGQRLELELRGKPVAAEVVRLPFVPHRSRPRATM